MAPRLSSVAGCYGSSGLLAALLTVFRLLLLRLAVEPERFVGEGDLPLVGEGERLAALPFLGGEAEHLVAEVDLDFLSLILLVATFVALLTA